MSVSKRILISVISFFGAIIFAIPNLVILIAILLSIVGKGISLVFTLVFAWNIAKLVEHFYNKHKE